MTTIIDIIIAILAFIIATIQFIVQIREWRNKKRKDKLSKRLKDKAEKVTLMFDGCFRKFESIDIKEKLYMKKLEYFNDGSQIHLHEELCYVKEYYSYISECFKELQENILKTKDESKEMLALLLSCESEFSLSYGFDRYINVTRELAFGTWFSENNVKIEILLSSSEDIIQLLQKGESDDDETLSMPLKILTTAIMRHNPSLIQKLATHECEKLVPTMVKDYNIFEAGWDAYYSLLEVMKSSTPLMEEMKLKFGDAS